VVLFAPVGTRDDRKDTAGNVLATGERAVHVVPRALAEAMNDTGATLPADTDELDHAGLTVAVDAPRVAEAPVALECTLYAHLEVGGSTFVPAAVVHAHVDDDLLADGRLDAVGRLAGDWYATTRDRFALDRPPRPADGREGGTRPVAGG